MIDTPAGDSPPLSTSPRGLGLLKAGLVMWLVLVAWFYTWTAISAGSPLEDIDYGHDYYNLLVSAFMAGQTSLLMEPDPRLAALNDPWDPTERIEIPSGHDLSYYQGRYYIYFGPTPLLLMLPFKVITGVFLPGNLGVVIFSWLGALTGTVILWDAWRRYAARASWLVFAAGVVLVTAGNFVSVLLRRPVQYELAIASAMAMAMIAVWALQRADMSTGPRWRRVWWAVAGTAFGLAVAGRPHYGLAVGLFALIPLSMLWQSWRTKDTRRLSDLWENLAWMLPLGGVVGALLVYNFVRFDSPWEFGTSYMFAGMHPTKQAVTGLLFVPANAFFYLLSPPHWIAWFPFIAVTPILPFQIPVSYQGVENVYGILPTLPAALFAFWWWLGGGAWRVSPVRRRWTAMVSGLVLGPFSYLLIMGGATSRYMVDFVPMLMILAAVAALHSVEMAGRKLRRLLVPLWCSLVAYCALTTTLISIQHNNLLAHWQPELTARMATWSERATEPLLNALGGPKAGKRTLHGVKFPTDQIGKLQPLVVTGNSFQADFLWLFYLNDGRVIFGFEHTSAGGPKTEPITIDYAVPHTLEVEMGSFYPPVTHPYWDGIPSEERAERKGRLRVVLDGMTLFDQEQAFFEASPGDVSVGRNHVSTTFGREFTGTIERVEVTPP